MYQQVRNQSNFDEEPFEDCEEDDNTFDHNDDDVEDYQNVNSGGDDYGADEEDLEEN